MSTQDEDSDVSGIYGAPYEPCYLARRLEQIAVSIFLDLNKHLNLTPTQYAALGAISDFPDYEQRVIARLIAVDRSTINGVTKRMEAAGLLIRKPIGRTITLTLTEKGESLLASVRSSELKHKEIFLSPLTEKQSEQFIDLMRKVVEGNNEASRTPMERPAAK